MHGDVGYVVLGEEFGEDFLHYFAAIVSVVLFHWGRVDSYLSSMWRTSILAVVDGDVDTTCPAAYKNNIEYEKQLCRRQPYIPPNCPSKRLDHVERSRLAHSPVSPVRTHSNAIGAQDAMDCGMRQESRT